MKKENFEYMLCAILYSKWKQNVDIWGEYRFFLNSLFMQVLVLFGRNKFKALRRWISNREFIAEHLDCREGGAEIYRAERWIEVGVLTYGTCLGFILTGLVIKMFNPSNKLILLLPIIIISVILEIYLNKSLFWNKNYLKYFRLFDRENLRWHEKWIVISYVFMLGGIATLITGIGLMFAIAGR